MTPPEAYPIKLRMKEYGLVSIITPCYNCAPFIADTIRSVQRQTYQDWEMIIIDDLSTDQSVERIKPFLSDPRIKLLENARNVGAALTRNHALRLAKGRWVAFLDADDQWMPEKLERQLEFMDREGYAFTYTNYTETNEFNHDLGTCVSGPEHIGPRGMLRYCWPGCLTVMYDRQVVGLLQIPDIRKNNDYAMWLRVIRKAPCHLLPQTLAIYRQRPGSISGQTWLSLVEWHYRLFRHTEGYGLLHSLLLTAQNMVCGIYKKLVYVKKL